VGSFFFSYALLKKCRQNPNIEFYIYSILKLFLGDEYYRDSTELCECIDNNFLFNLIQKWFELLSSFRELKQESGGGE
jgi:hypothetical protein